MATPIKEKALAMALTATRDLMQPDGATTVKVARQFEEYLLEASSDQTTIERDQARARVVQLERELAGDDSDRAAFALRAVLKQAREGCKGLDRLLVESTVETVADTIGITL